MHELTSRHKLLLKTYHRPIVHMRKQVKLGRFGLIFGAGLTKPIRLPNWEELVKLLAKDSEIKGTEILKNLGPRGAWPYVTEMLFEHYKRKQYEHSPQNQHNSRQLDYRIGAQWKQIVRNNLYRKISGPLGSYLASHPYLNAYLSTIKDSYMTVTYNFDDFLEQALLTLSYDDDPRVFESVTNPWTQFRKQSGIIYHPNGIIPQNHFGAPTDRFVFSEATYAEQLMGIFAGDQAGLVNHLSKYTCLLVGLSLEDETLRNVLVQNARACPGNFHYYVQYVNKDKSLTKAQKHAIWRANFKVYNLITLFLDDVQLKSLGEMINPNECPETQFQEFASQHNITIRFVYYITGPLGAGKSTTVNLFRSLTAYDEWIEQPPDILAKYYGSLTTAEKKDADNFILSQFDKKNRLVHRDKEGISLCDRGPLDPLAFTKERQWTSKATRLLDVICPGQCDWTVQPGRVILLDGDYDEMAIRLAFSQRTTYDSKKLEKMALNLSKAYGNKGVVRVDTRGLNPADVARRIAEIIHVDDYEPCNVHERLEEIKGNGYDAC